MDTVKENSEAVVRKIVLRRKSLVFFLAIAALGATAAAISAAIRSLDSDSLSLISGMGFLVWLFFRVGRSRVELDGSGVTLIGLLVKVRMPWGAVTKVSHDNGLGIRDTSGTQQGVLAFGGSLLEEIFEKLGKGRISAAARTISEAREQALPDALADTRVQKRLDLIPADLLLLQLPVMQGLIQLGII
ncbi:hypothetical protein [Streptomyces sp. HUAS TT7]|uniref:hypothetical protein n=1 Tax=Streptomyces sp. HUAS TT7 TaxID=3447507 RepID=UPI003F655273